MTNVTNKNQWVEIDATVIQRNKTGKLFILFGFKVLFGFFFLLIKTIDENYLCIFDT